jgi:CubicO group peptidase (beta-lactamase class C family)
MAKTIITGLAVLAFVAALVAAAPMPLSATSPAESEVDKIFAKWTMTTPGCAVGVAMDGRPVLTKAYGMADLEHGVKNDADTIFEAGSVSKQFTAAAILLLAKDGKLSLDDPARKHIPELPDYGTPLTIRHMMHHMSGLRDWGSVEDIAGWPRTSRAYTHDHVLDIVSRQKALNFPPGAQYSYSNTGFNLAAIIVSRVSGMPFADFTRQRIFTPLGMTRTSWRDDFTRIVPGRAVAYRASGAGFQTQMPFENVHGNGGLLTTVGDLLKWNENFVKPVVGDAAFVSQQQVPGVFSSGKPGSYAFGLVVGNYRGVKKVDHSGSTAGYRAHLSRFPDQHASVAVLCNVSTGDATRSADAVADVYLAGRLAPAPPPPARPADPAPMKNPPTAAQLAELAGSYWSDEAEVMLIVEVENGAAVIKRRPAARMPLAPSDTDTFRVAGLGTVTFRRNAAGKIEGLSVGQDRVFDMRFTRAN